MDIPNLSTSTLPKTTPLSPESLSQIKPLPSKPEKLKPTYILIVALSAIFISFWLSRFFPSGSNKAINFSGSQKTISADTISSASDLEVGKTYGQSDGNFSDTAVGVIEKGNINGVGTHILNRQGGASQRASLISSVVDLDMFVDKKVEIKGETNTSDKTSWLLDVGSIKVLE